jgi:hypothetical protein
MRGDVLPRCASLEGRRRFGFESARWLLTLLVASPWACQREHEVPAPPAPTAAPSMPPPEADLPASRERAARSAEVASTAHFSMSFSTMKECPVESHFKPREGFVTLGVEVTIQALGAVQVPVNPFYATLIDANNVVYESTLAGCQPALGARQLSDGARVSGWLSFDVPAQARGLRLAYAPVLLGAGREELLFQLGR